ncbi:MAG: hypothetical protein JNL84_07485 [Candidatus Accumulibacter sp.]|nr:hypothetical protein [Accumulibacter sp.]
MRGKRAIFGGRGPGHRGLYRAALAAIRFGAVTESLHDRLVACRRKRLTIVNAMVRAGKARKDSLYTA